MRRSESVRVVVAWWLSGTSGLIVARGSGRPLKLLLGLQALRRRRRRLVLVEFLPVPGGGVGRFLLRWAVAPLLRRCLLRAQVTTEWERGLFIETLGLAPGRLSFIPVAAIDAVGDLHVYDAGSRAGVMSSGYAACDWDLLLEAAEGRNWDLTIVCGRKAARSVRAMVDSRGSRVRATVLADVPLSEHRALLRRALVYVLPLREEDLSSGQVRMANATTAGVPVVATATRGLEGYAEDGRTALLVEPGDAMALGAAVDRLLDDPGMASRLVAAAQERGRRYPDRKYSELLGEFVRSAARDSYGGGR